MDIKKGKISLFCGEMTIMASPAIYKYIFSEEYSVVLFDPEVHPVVLCAPEVPTNTCHILCILYYIVLYCILCILCAPEVPTNTCHIFTEG